MFCGFKLISLLSQEPLFWPEFFSADGQSLFARGEVSPEGVLPLLRWDVNAPTHPPQTIPLDLKSTNGIWETACAANRPLYAVSQKGMDGISLWNPLTGEAAGQLRTLAIGRPWKFSPDGRKLLSITGWNDFRITDLSRPENPMLGRLPAAFMGRPAFSLDGRFMAIALTDRTIRLWDITLFQEVAVLSGHQASVTDVAFSPDGRTLASCGSGVKLWSLPARREVATVTTEDPGFNFVAFTPDGNALLAGDWSGRVRIWRVPTLAEIDGQP